MDTENACKFNAGKISGNKVIRPDLLIRSNMIHINMKKHKQYKFATI